MRHNYMLLGRMQRDCKVYLDPLHNYYQSTHCLYAGDEQAQIDKMRELWHSFPEDKKPEWLTLEQINEYATKMGVK